MIILFESMVVRISLIPHLILGIVHINPAKPDNIIPPINISGISINLGKYGKAKAIPVAPIAPM